MSSLATKIIIGAALAGNFNSIIGNAVSGIGQINHSVGQLGGALAQLGGAWASLRGISAAVSIASDMEHELKQAGITAGMTNEEIAALKDHLRDLAVPERTNQSMGDLLKAFNSLVSAGMDKAQAKAMLESLGRTATATQADVDDLAKTAFVLNDTLGIKPEGMAKALDQLAYAGQQGSFELKSMARYFPTLGGSAKALGLQGAEAVTTLGAALQIAMKKAADPSEAANNMKNFMAKIMAPETLKKFKEHGVNLVRVRDEAIKNGQNPFEALLEQVNKKTKGGQIDLLGQFFGDMQVQDFIQPMLANFEKYKQLKADIGKASGTVDTDFARMMETNKELLKGFNAQLNKLSEAVGAALLPPFNAVLRIITPVVTVLGDMANASPATASALVAIGTVCAVLPPVIGLVTAAWTTANAAFLFSPIGLTIAAIAVGAALLIDNWGAVKSFFSTIWNGVTEHWRTILAFTGPLGWIAIKVIDNWAKIREVSLALWDGVAEKWGELVTAVAPIGEAISGAFDTAWGKVTDIWDGGVTTIMAIWDKVRGPLTDFARMMGWVAPDSGAVPQIGAAAPTNDNKATANDNAPKATDVAQPGEVVKAAVNQSPVAPGSGVAAAEAKGGAAMGAASASATPAAAQPAQVPRVEVVLSLPTGMRADVKSAAPGVTIIARTGQAMVGDV